MFLIVAINSETSTLEKMKEDLVEINDGKMIYEEFGIYKLNFKRHDPVSFQLKYYVEATKYNEYISRDNFVAITTFLRTYILQMMVANDYKVTIAELMENSDFKEIDEPIGNLDIEINVYMTKVGIQLELLNHLNDSKMRKTIAWDEIEK